MSPQQAWTRLSIIKEVQRLAKKGPLWFRHLRRDHRPLLRAAERLFGRWPLALRGAGVPLYSKGKNPGPAIYTRGSVLKIMRTAWGRGDVRIDPLRRRHAGIYKAARRFFGTWQ